MSRPGVRRCHTGVLNRAVARSLEAQSGGMQHRPEDSITADLQCRSSTLKVEAGRRPEVHLSLTVAPSLEAPPRLEVAALPATPSLEPHSMDTLHRLLGARSRRTASQARGPRSTHRNEPRAGIAVEDVDS